MRLSPSGSDSTHQGTYVEKERKGDNHYFLRSSGASVHAKENDATNSVTTLGNS